jgi:hypothetical protein
MRRLVAWARFVIVIVLAVGIWVGVSTYRKIKRELDQSRAELLAQINAAQADVTAKDRGAVDRASAHVTRLAGPYEGDVAATNLEAELTRPAVYIRGSVDTLRSREALGGAAAVSGKDALLVCLLDPPATRSEPLVIEKVRFVHAGGAPLEERTANVRRLNDAVVGLPFLSTDFAERARNADDVSDIARMKKDLERAPLERAKRALRAEVLIAAVDEKGDGAGPTELDGERPHDIRVAIVDLDSGRVILRARRHVDPSWIAVNKRPVYSNGADSCALGFDLRHAK